VKTAKLTVRKIAKSDAAKIAKLTAKLTVKLTVKLIVKPIAKLTAKPIVRLTVKPTINLIGVLGKNYSPNGFGIKREGACLPFFYLSPQDGEPLASFTSPRFTFSLETP
jgi:hypothetical protein